MVSARGAVIKIEPNATLRGSVYPSSVRRTTPTVETEFEQSVSVSVLSKADLYGGKLVAALDRQHPRDLFDAKLLLDAEGLTDEVRMAFVVYLASHGRPISEILDPGLKPLQKLFEGEFAGMTRAEFTCRELEDTRAQLIHLVRSDLTPSRARIFAIHKTSGASIGSHSSAALATVARHKMEAQECRGARKADEGSRCGDHETQKSARPVNESPNCSDCVLRCPRDVRQVA